MGLDLFNKVLTVLSYGSKEEISMIPQQLKDAFGYTDGSNLIDLKSSMQLALALSKGKTEANLELQQMASAALVDVLKVKNNKVVTM